MRGQYINVDDVIGYCLDLRNKMRRILISLLRYTLSITGSTSLSMMSSSVFRSYTSADLFLIHINENH